MIGMLNKLTLQEMRDDYDWREALDVAEPKAADAYTGSIERFTFDDVEQVIVAQVGRPGGTSWRAVLRLKDERFVFVTAWCDDHRWGCACDGDQVFAATLEDLIRYLLDAVEGATRGAC